MHDTDIRVVEADVSFPEVGLNPPLTLSGGAITWFTVAQVRVTGQSAAGGRATGYGESILSVPWSWPSSTMTIEQRDTAMRDAVIASARGVSRKAFADPITLWRCAASQLDRRHETVASGMRMPRLSALLALGAVDNAVHDAWANAAEMDVFRMYTREHLRDDLSAFGLPGAYPSDGVIGVGSGDDPLPVQHVVGATDELTASGTQRGLTEWIAAEGVSRFKIKIAGEDPFGDATRIRDVYRTALAGGLQPRLAVDPNEGFRTPQAALAMLDALAELDPDAARGVDYLEQPIPRGLAADPEHLRALSHRVPVLMDEGFTSLSALPKMQASGWSGIVIKASKGQTPAVVGAAVARRLGLRIAVQDLTASGAAFVHSVQLARRLQTTITQLEYNSRQYAPTANSALRKLRAGLVDVVGGRVQTDGLDGRGLYGMSFDGV